VPESGAVSPRRPKIQHFSFAATKIQLTGPLPPSLVHQYVVFRPIIKTFYTKKGLLGVALNRALKHQYRTIYSYNKNTTYGVCDTDANKEGLARKLLEFTRWGEGGRLYTYIITLDGEWRFTETGKEFGIQMLSKVCPSLPLSLQQKLTGGVADKKSTPCTAVSASRLASPGNSLCGLSR